MQPTDVTDHIYLENYASIECNSATIVTRTKVPFITLVREKFESDACFGNPLFTKHKSLILKIADSTTDRPTITRSMVYKKHL